MILGFVGAGSMATAMARGWARTAEHPRMLFCDADKARAERLATSARGETRPDLRALCGDSDALLLAVKPGALEAVAEELKGCSPAIISVLAATSVERLRGAFPSSPILRVMPNQPVEVGRGVLVHAPPTAGAEHLVALLRPLGTRVEVPEDQIDAAMAIMSCSPAYIALFAQALAGAGADNGLDESLSLELVAGTLEGTAELLRHHDPVAVQRAVAPPGGATEAGLERLARDGFASAIEGAVTASLKRFSQ
jgi:pyrroline-5-carboxylate reductase